MLLKYPHYRESHGGKIYLKIAVQFVKEVSKNILHLSCFVMMKNLEKLRQVMPFISGSQYEAVCWHITSTNLPNGVSNFHEVGVSSYNTHFAVYEFNRGLTGVWMSLFLSV